MGSEAQLSAGDWASPTSTTPERLALHELEVELATMNGALRLAAAGADRVVRFDLELPIADSAPAPQVVPFRSLARQRKAVVVVEDDGAIRLAMQRTLSDVDHQVLEVSAGPDAQRLLSEMGLAVDLMVSDLALPRGSGPNLFAWLKATCPRVNRSTACSEMAISKLTSPWVRHTRSRSSANVESMPREIHDPRY